MKTGSRLPRMKPHQGPQRHDDEKPLIGGKSGTLRAAIFGLNDGLVSNLALIMGVAGAGLDHTVVLITGVAGLLAGAFSMGGGEYVSMRSQRELFERAIHIEAHELGADPEGETQELDHMLRKRGIPAAVSRQAAESIMRDPEQALDVHVREEFGLDVDDLGSPWGAAFSSFLTFGLGAFVPLIPYLFTGGVVAAWTAVGISLGALFTVGAALSALTRRSPLYSGLRMAVIGGGLALVTFGVGNLLGVRAT